MAVAVRKEEYGWDQLIKDISTAMGQLTGNILSDKQRPMVESRIKRRLLELNLETPADYHNYWMENHEDENKHLIGLLTTHFTSFFREFAHFEWIAKELPLLVKAAREEKRSSITIWSAACSKGQEVWSLAMWLHHHMPKIDPTMGWSIHGTDIDEKSVEEGMNGVYHKRELETAPRHLWEGLWSKGTGEISDWYRAKNVLRGSVSFGPMNLMKLSMPADKKFDIVICRNVFIYFERTDQERIARDLIKHLRPEGALITGMSESMNGFDLGVHGVFPSIYKRNEAKVEVLAPKVAEVARMPVPLKVLCIDDSSVVLNLMKKILVGPEFEIIGTALNGEDAKEKMKLLKPDAITLDIHMPVMDGPTFLKDTSVAKDLPVIMVSSVDRSDDAMINPLFDLGVVDFVEKPSLQNMDKMAAEIRQKLKMAWEVKSNKLSTSSSKKIEAKKKRPAGRIVFNYGEGDEKNIRHVLLQQSWDGDELIFVSRKPSEELKKLTEATLGPHIKVKHYMSALDIPASVQPRLWLHFKAGTMSFVNISKKPHDFLVLEEAPSLDKKWSEESDDISPATSFSYLVDKFLGGR